jgi:hypothetical protein
LDLQDKAKWCKIGLVKEIDFIIKYGKRFCLEINKNKIEDKFAPDLFDFKNGKFADLKTQNTPFFMAWDLYSYCPQFTVVFNKKDRSRYLENYKNIDIYFWIDWHRISLGKYCVIPMECIAKINFQNLNRLCLDEKLHKYKQRINDKKGNAKESYLIMITNNYFERNFIINDERGKNE